MELARELAQHVKTEELVGILGKQTERAHIELLRQEIQDRSQVAKWVIKQLGDAFIEHVYNSKSPFYDLVDEAHVRQYIYEQLHWRVGFIPSGNLFIPVTIQDCALIVTRAENTNLRAPQHLDLVAEKMAKTIELLCNAYKSEGWTPAPHRNNTDTIRSFEKIKTDTDWNKETTAVVECLTQIFNLKFLYEHSVFVLAAHAAVVTLRDQKVFDLDESVGVAIRQLEESPIVVLATSLNEGRANAQETQDATNALIDSLSIAKNEITLPQLTEALKKCATTRELVRRYLPNQADEFQNNSSKVLGGIIRTFVTDKMVKGKNSEVDFESGAAEVVELLKDIHQQPHYSNLLQDASHPLERLRPDRSGSWGYWSKWAQVYGLALQDRPTVT